MRTYTLHLDGDAMAGEAHGLERAHLVPDGFSWAAFAFSPLWFLYHRLWIATVGVVALLVGTAFLGHVLGLTDVAALVVTLLVLTLIGLEASSLRRWTYARCGRPVRDAVIAASPEEAEMKAARRWLDGISARPVSAPASPTGLPGRPTEEAFGMFPFSEDRR
ncbi:DUF2628 domain-containing protein [Methylobacterium sp. BTF04]|uniref:DUF2628 domain-containing protein n=1 Tax=Methylobacterium sp. BTF04 TaxID=2708300 RepID=UPI0013D6A96B|nr:DUF2628 domain-containing protein [Methylobacterium sp. BTF04]NEU10948.1 DUF2628 domain-containing protein [Methylobacterium sp. BTF04]